MSIMKVRPMHSLLFSDSVVLTVVNCRVAVFDLGFLMVDSGQGDLGGIQVL